MEFASFQLSPLDAVDSTMLKMRSSNENRTILFDHHAEIYRYVEETKKWSIYGAGNMQISDETRPNSVQLSLHHEGSNISPQSIDKNTQFNEKQMTEGVLTWVEEDLSKNKGEKRQWAVKFNDIETCKIFHNIITVATSAAENANESQNEDVLNEILEFSVTESPEELKRHCENVYKAKKNQRLWHNLQTWNELNKSLGISTDSQIRYYERILKNKH